MTTDLKTVLEAGYGKKQAMNKLKGIRDNDLSGVNNQVYYDKDNNKAILNVKGTNPLSVRDLYADLALGIGGTKGLRNSSRFKESQKIYDKVKQKYPDANLTITGHSLGKNVGELLTDKKKDMFVGLNGYQHPFKPTASVGGRFQNYRTPGDVVSLFSANAKNVKTVGGFKNPFDIIGNHSVKSLSRNIRV